MGCPPLPSDLLLDAFAPAPVGLEFATHFEFIVGEISSDFEEVKMGRKGEPVYSD